MKKLLRITWRWLRYAFAVLGLLLLLMALLPWLFPGPITRSVKSWANQSLDARLDFSKTHLSFFRHFPALTVSLDDVSLTGSPPFSKDTLLRARELALGINLWSVFFEEQTHIDKIFLTEGRLDVQVNEKGEANYNVYRSKPATAKPSTTSDSSSASLKLEAIILDEVDVVYRDESVGILLVADKLEYEGTGDLEKALFELDSHLEAEAVDFVFDGSYYLRRKQLRADLVTRINTNSLQLIFERNLLRINRLPVEFTGHFDFLADGYDMNFKLATRDADLAQLATALPPAYQDWVKNTQLRGDMEARVVLAGVYSVARNSMPNLSVDFRVADGVIQHREAPVPLRQLNTRFQLQLPQLNTDSLRLNLDSLAFSIGSGYLRLAHQSVGLEQMDLQSNLQTALDLATLDTTLGVPGLTLGGMLRVDGQAKGKLNWTGNDLILPKGDLRFHWQDGLLRFAQLPEAIQQIQARATVQSSGKHWQDISIQLDTLTATANRNKLQASFRINNLQERNLTSYITADLNLSSWSQFLPMGGWKLGGAVKAKAQASGIWLPDKNQYPVATIQATWENGMLQTPYYPAPIQEINLQAQGSSKQGTLAGMQLSLQPLQFRFEEQPIKVTAELQNFAALNYQVQALGKLDVGHLAKVFPGVPGNVAGQLDANLQAQGNQADVLAGRYNRLKQSGTLEVSQLVWQTDFLPKPLEIPTGVFRFQQDKMWFQSFQARCGQSDMRLDGYLYDAIGHFLNPAVPLKGRFQFRSNQLDVADFMTGASTADTSRTSVDTSAGVVFLPSNWDLALNTQIKKLRYNALEVSQIESDAFLKGGRLGFDSTRFTVVGTAVSMQGYYEPRTKKRAAFKYALEAKDFDVYRAYQEVPLFRQMASAAAYARGKVSLNYALEGQLDAGMKPVLPSLQGGGELQVHDVKLKGFRLLNTVSKETGKSEIRDPNLRKITIRSTVKNNVLTLERFKVKMAGFRLRVQGQTRLDGALKLRMRLGLPPLGIIGIPMRVTGTHTNPRVRLGKGDSDPLEETADSEAEDNSNK